MPDDTRTGSRSASRDRGKPLAELGLPLEQLLRRGARDMLQRVIEAEAQAEAQVLLDEFAGVAPSGGAQR